MNNTINVNCMTRINSYFQKSVQNNSLKNDSSLSITDTIRNVISKDFNGIDELPETDTISKENMSLDEYRKYISDKISSFPLHPSQIGNSFSINISDVSLQKMKDDPEYEKWLLNDVKSSFGSAVPGWYQAIGGPSTYCVLNYENGEKGCWCHMWSTGYKGGSSDARTMFDNESKDNTYIRRADKRKEAEKAQQRKALQKHIKEKKIADEVYEAKLRNKKYMLEYYDKKFYKGTNLQGWAQIPVSTHIKFFNDSSF